MRTQMFHKGSTLPDQGTQGYATGAMFLKTDGNGKGMYTNIGTISSCTFVENVTPISTQINCVAGGVSVTSAGGDTSETVTSVGHLPVSANAVALVGYSDTDDSDTIDNCIFATNTLTYVGSADPSTAHDANWALFDKGGTPYAIPVAGGVYTTAGGNAAEDVTEYADVLATDIVLAQLNTVGATPRVLESAIAAGGNEIELEFTGDPAADTQMNVIVLRPLNTMTLTSRQSHKVFAMGSFASTTGSATQTTSIAGLKTTDICFARPSVSADANDSILSVKCATNGTLTIIQSADPAGTGYTYDYVVFRAI